MVDEEDDGEDADDFDAGDLTVVETQQIVGLNDSPKIDTTPGVSLNSVMGLTNPKTMKMAEVVNGRTVVVMIDPGATHNFISTIAAQKLDIQPSESKRFGVALGTGEAVHGEGVCKGVLLELQGVSIVEDFLILPLGNSDLILGIQWLEKLGTIATNWKTQVMKFQLGESSVTLRGDHSLGRSGISLKAMIKTLKKEQQGFLVELNHLVGLAQGETIVSKIPLFLQNVLEDFKGVFEMLEGLPPRRPIKHSIVLKEGTDPVSVRPYRYPQSQKDEIERLVQDMLAAGIIQPSSSAYSSPVLLVKNVMDHGVSVLIIGL